MLRAAAHSSKPCAEQNGRALSRAGSPFSTTPSAEQGALSPPGSLGCCWCPQAEHTPQAGRVCSSALPSPWSSFSRSQHHAAVAIGTPELQSPRSQHNSHLVLPPALLPLPEQPCRAPAPKNATGDVGLMQDRLLCTEPAQRHSACTQKHVRKPEFHQGELC